MEKFFFLIYILYFKIIMDLLVDKVECILYMYQESIK